MYRDLELEVLNCPFCGSDPIFKNIGNRLTSKRTVEISCKNCSVIMKTSAIHRDMDWLEDVSVQKWNTRKDIKGMNNLEELEKEILQSFLKDGYKIGKGNWWFKVHISSRWKNKELKVFFFDGKEINTVFISTTETVELMYSNALKNFKKRR